MLVWVGSYGWEGGDACSFYLFASGSSVRFLFDLPTSVRNQTHSQQAELPTYPGLFSYSRYNFT